MDRMAPDGFSGGTAAPTSREGEGSPVADPGTKLDGIRQKVFLDRYSLKDKDGRALEQYPEQVWERVARGIAAVEPGAEQRALWEREFYQTMQGFRFVPGGRILAGAGTGHAVTYYNCFQGDTPVHLREGIVPIGGLSGEHEVLGEGGVYRVARFQSYGEQRLWSVALANGATYYATADHQWVVVRAGGGTRRITTRELAGEHVPINPRPAPPRDADFAAGVRHGIVYGDGSEQYGRAHVALFGEAEGLASWFSQHDAKRAGGTAATKAHVRVQGLPATWKRELPSSGASASYWRGFVAGLLAADGHVDARGSVALYNKDATLLGQIAEGMALAGFVSSSITLVREDSPFDGSEKPLYRLQFYKSTVEADDLLLPSHRRNFELSPTPRQSSVRVVDVRETDRVEEVFCCVEPETHTITIGHGYLTGQCYVIESPEDSRGGILDNLKTMTEIMARGGGVGLNLSTLRPRGSYIRTVNGTASGPCSWAELYSVATGDVIQQGGSRRGALMLMLDDDHPDIEEFITVKRDPRRINHANLSVCVSDAFMEAVKRDDDWKLIWKGEVRKVVKARYIWGLICRAAWESAEPGVVFLDRYNKLSNTWYYEKIISVNPCGEQGLPAYGVCNLGALNLATFVADGQLDYAALARHSKVAIRFLDNVIDANEYFLEENRRSQLGTRRTGLGTMGLADALIKLQVRYGGDESLRVIDRIYRTIRDAAYEASSELAAEKGPFPSFDRERYLQGAFIQRLPAELRERIARDGIRNAVLLTQAPTGTTSLLAGVSSGIEPVYDFVMRRRDRTGEHVLYHPLFGQWREAHADAPVPDYFVSASELTPEEHVRVQAKVQEYTDSSISKCVTGETLLPTREGLRRIDEFYRDEAPDTFRPLALVLAGESGEVTTDQFYFGGVKPVRRVRLKTGVTIAGTPNHRIRVYDPRSKAVAWKYLADVEPGDEVSLAVGTEVFGNRCAWSEIYGQPFSYERTPQHKDVTIPKKLTSDLARWLGYLVADGSIGENTVKLSQTRNEVVDDFVAITRERFGIEATVATDKQRDNLVSVNVNSQELVAFLRYLGMETGAAQKTVPLCIRAAGREVQEQFVRGLTLDGYVSSLDRRVVLTSVSETLCREVQMMLLNLGIVCRLSAEPIEYAYKGDARNDWSFEVSVVPRFVPLFEARIGYAEQRKAKQVLQGYDRWDAVPVGLVERQLAELKARKRESLPDGIHTVGSGRLLRSLGEGDHARLTRHYIQDQLVLFSEFQDSEAYQTLWQLGRDAAFFDPVVEVTEETAPVYDLSVPEVHAFVGSGIVNHNTVNAPNSHTVEDVERLYTLAYELGCKGITYFRDGSREGVLSHVEEDKPKAASANGGASQEGREAGKDASKEAGKAVKQDQAPAQLRPRPHALTGKTYRIKTPVGTAFVTINADEQGNPFEVFVTVGKAGSDIRADADALGRMISLALRIPSAYTPKSVAEAIVDQLSGIGGSNSLGFGSARVRSLPDAVAKVLAEHLGVSAGGGNGGNGNGHGHGEGAIKVQTVAPPEPASGERKALIGDFCPSCGQISLVYEEGCRKCYACGYSNC